jgi:hypothetical protein
MDQFSHHQTAGVPLKLWDSAGPFEAGAMQQLRNVAGAAVRVPPRRGHARRALGQGRHGGLGDCDQGGDRAGGGRASTSAAG